MKFIYNNSRFMERRRLLRKNQTDGEKLLWNKLRNKQINRIKFYRQYSIGPYIIDFYCPSCKLAIEIDGSQHIENKKYDLDRTGYLNNKGINVIRFWSNEVLRNIDGVLENILTTVTPPSPLLG